MSWNEIKVGKLKELWGKGSTASQIAEIIGGISRNAVIGKAHRLNLLSKFLLEMHLQVKILIIVRRKTLLNREEVEKASFSP